MSIAAKKMDQELEAFTEAEETKVSSEIQAEESEAPDSIVRNYLRLLTWEELIEIASVFDASSMSSLTDILDKDLFAKEDEDDQNEEENHQEMSIESDNESSHKAKIIPFNQEEDASPVRSEEDDSDYDFDKYDHELDEIEEKNVIQVNRQGGFSIYDREAEIQRKKKELKKVNVGEFILRQKKKFEHCQKNLKKKEIYKMYKSTSAVDVNASKKHDDKKRGITTTSNTGQLVNKRQK